MLSPSAPFSDPALYRQLVGKLLYLSNHTRPDLTHSVIESSRHMMQPSQDDWLHLKRIIRYLAGTISLGLHYTRDGTSPSSTPSITAYSDATWGSSPDRKSDSGALVTLSNAPILWLSKRQQSTSLSSTESELVALSVLVQDLIWVTSIIKFILSVDHVPITSYCDNRGTISSSLHPTGHSRLKHIHLRHQFVVDNVRLLKIDLRWIASSENPADAFTKSSTVPYFQSISHLLVSSP
jgi:hypothetical protein